MNNKQFTSSLVFLLHQITISMDIEGDSLLKQECGISYAQFMILMIAREYPDTKQQHIAQMLSMTRSAISQNIETLANKNLIVRITNPEIRRENIIRLTEEGHDVVTNSYSILLTFADSYFETLTQSEHSQFKAILNKIILHKKL